MNFLQRVSSRVRYNVQVSPLRSALLSGRHRGVHPEDVFLGSYPKCGNTWLRHLLTYVVTKTSTPWRGGIDQVSDLIGRHGALPKLASGGGRLIKTHEPWRSEYRRAVTLVRDGRDVAVSEFYFQRAYSKHFFVYNNSFAKFLELFLRGRTNGYGSWQSHVQSWLNAAEDPANEILLLPFERLKQSTIESLHQVCEHIGIEADNQLVQDAVMDCSVESMKKKEKQYWASRGEPSRNFVRSGKSGGWQSEFTPALEEQFWELAGDTMNRLGYTREKLS